uniref:Partial AB-hydrolase lipase domain-containing protein n=1 Tax=Pristionchus pacificus TaxID=54126 RepID=A0A8R1UWT9_PRIPA
MPKETPFYRSTNKSTISDLWNCRNGVPMRVLLFNFLVFAAAQRNLQDERSMGSMEIITHRGYPAEKHKVVTKDGYILTLHRIPHGRNGRKGRGPVLLQHGLVSSSFDYLSLQPSQSLSESLFFQKIASSNADSGTGYSLADAGYDVWLGNNRGNIYSNEHVDDNNDNYWNFSWHEMGEYDFPAMIDYILEVTQRPNLFLVGHSQGSHAFIIATNHYPEIQRKVKHHFAMAPSLSSFHLRSFIIRLATVQPQLVTIALSVIPDQAYSVPVFQPVCGQSSWLSWCKWILKEFSGSMDQIDEEHLPLLTANFPGGTSNKNWMHYLQKLKSGTKHFDHGTKGNLEAYGTKHPRDYDFSQYSVPTSLFFSPSDKLVSTEDMKMEMIAYRGYPAEEHKVVTKDGYILTMHRIPHGRNGTRGGVPVLLQHGLMSSSFDFLSQLPDKSLSYSLADAGYDVWLGNNRGNIYSTEHVRLARAKSRRYWDFSWDEMGRYDFPAMINYVFNVVRKSRMHVIGHSQRNRNGYRTLPENIRISRTLRILKIRAWAHSIAHSRFAGIYPDMPVATTHNPEIQTKVENAQSSLRYPYFGNYRTFIVKHFFAIAPSLSSAHLGSVTIQIATAHPEFVEQAALALIPDRAYSLPVLVSFCGRPAMWKPCKWIFNEFAGPMDQVDEDRLPVFTAHLPGGTSNRNIKHYFQKIKNGTKYYDYGFAGNLKAYGSPYPREYNFSGFTVPTSVYYSPADKLVSTADIKIGLASLPSSAIVRERNLTGFGHFEFIWGNRAKDEIYNEIIDVLNLFSPKLTVSPVASPTKMIPAGVQIMNSGMNS